MTKKIKVRTCLWFASKGEEAAHFYVSLLPDSQVEWVTPHAIGAEPLVVHFRLAGVPYMILNGGPVFKLTEAASIFVSTKDQMETDHLCGELTARGGMQGRCGWLTDRFGVSWQIIPEALMRLLSDPDQAAAGRAMQAMMQMMKIDIAALEAAFKG